MILRMRRRTKATRSRMSRRLMVGILTLRMPKIMATTAPCRVALRRETFSMRCARTRD
jgi:hypothetical protein